MNDMDISIVVGALYGDEGKGLVVDWLARQKPDAVVVRANGGAQAAHTVQLPDGTRHVFHHFGSGTLNGNDTYLTRYMTCNPIEFNREYDRLVSMGYTPRVTVSPNAQLTIPQDMLINQAIEEYRGNARHGSCGLGINETYMRGELRHKFLVRPQGRPMTMEMLRAAREILGQRAAELQIDWERDMPQYIGLFMSDDILEAYLVDYNKFISRIEIRSEWSVFRERKQIIFEGAQGLCLDMDNMADFPYLTRSRTGVFNPVDLLDEQFKDFHVDAYYVARCYMTRHGAGPLPHERALPEINFDDPTNVPNPWQGTIRTAPLDIDLLFRNIEWDLKRMEKIGVVGEEFSPNIVITCLDQIKDKISIVENGVERLVGREYFERFDYNSYGPTHETIRCFKE